MANNLERMLDLVDDVFNSRHDNEQISVDEVERNKLFAIHPNCLSELANEDGPIVWVLVVPTTEDVMNRFLQCVISEKELLHKTPIGVAYDCIYLCSALVLPEFRNKGLAKEVALDALNKIILQHSISTLFYWPFTEEGRYLAEAIEKSLGLSLKVKVNT